jgi:hypothetical protein
LQVRR